MKSPLMTFSHTLQHIFVCSTFKSFQRMTAAATAWSSLPPSPIWQLLNPEGRRPRCPKTSLSSPHRCLPTWPALTAPAFSAPVSRSVSPSIMPLDLPVPLLESVFLQLSLWLAPVPPSGSSSRVALLRTSPTTYFQFYPHSLFPSLCFMSLHSAYHLQQAGLTCLSDYPSSKM